MKKCGIWALAAISLTACSICAAADNDGAISVDGAVALNVSIRAPLLEPQFRRSHADTTQARRGRHHDASVHPARPQVQAVAVNRH